MFFIVLSFVVVVLESDWKEVKGRLSRDTNSSWTCPRREGATFFIALRKKSPAAHLPPSLRESRHMNITPPKKGSDKLVIAALRVLVGSTTNYIPSKIYVQGRPVDLTPRAKKWYSIPLTDEEIALALRNGLVSFGIGESFDSSNTAVIDAIEVYAMDRETVESWLPKSLFCQEASSQFCSPAQMPSASAQQEGKLSPKSLILSARALTYLCSLIGPGKVISDEEKKFLRQLIQDTALDRDKNVTECIQILLESLEPDNRSRRSFYDESILFGCSKALHHAKEVVNQMDVDDDEGETGLASASKWEAVRSVLKDCLKAASLIARERPMNYLQGMENMVQHDVSSGSIAVDASKLILEGIVRSTCYEELIDGPGGIIDLSLTEMAIERNTDESHGERFAKFDVIRGFLECSKAHVVEISSEAISTFCRNHVGNDQSDNVTPDLFTLLQHSRLVAYQCDSCAFCPMKEVRYTLLEEGYDIE